MNTPQPSQSGRLFRFALLSIVLFVGFMAYDAYQRSRRITELENKITERVEKHKAWPAARRAEVKEMEEEAAKAGDDERERLTEESQEVRQVLEEAIAEDRAEILELWNEARKAGSKMPMPAFGE